MTMREELARRLHNAIRKPGGWEPEPEDSPLGDWTAVADECIRQMEWARADAGLEFEPGTNEVAPLTLAPDEWKP